jgi:hypothetical protein
MRLKVLGFATTIAVAALASPASADCTCRGPGVIAYHGQTICLKTPAGPRLARCEMVLNNSSWKFLAEACPEASLQSGHDFASKSAATHQISPVIR